MLLKACVKIGNSIDGMKNVPQKLGNTPVIWLLFQTFDVLSNVVTEQTMTNEIEPLRNTCGDPLAQDRVVATAVAQRTA
jgi:hypothetical protein